MRQPGYVSVNYNASVKSIRIFIVRNLDCLNHSGSVHEHVIFTSLINMGLQPCASLNGNLYLVSWKEIIRPFVSRIRMKRGVLQIR